MKKIAVGLIAITLTLGLANAALAGNSASHTVTVQVLPFNEVELSGGDVTMAVKANEPGQPFAEVSDSGTTQLRWATNESNKKITVQTSLAAAVAELRVQPVNVTGGVPTGIVSLTTTPQDLVTGISHTAGGCNLVYTATVGSVSQGATDVHVITYTLTNP